MRNIIKLILKYHFTIIFVLLEVFSVFLIVLHNNYQRSLFFKYTSSVTSSVAEKITGVKEYFLLKELNRQLSEENLYLKNVVERQQLLLQDSLIRRDSVDVDYIYRYGKVVNATFNKTKNYLTVNKGFADGIRKEMAVCSGDCAVGIIQNTSVHHAIVQPLINVNSRISAKIRKNNYYGSLQWDGRDYRYSFLKDIPFHVNVEQGDTIVTSGFSIFPEGKIIGFVEAVDHATANFLLIKVRLAADFKNISGVYVIEDINREEQLLLEEENNDQP